MIGPGLYRTHIVRVKPPRDSADPPPVDGFSNFTWLTLAAITAIGVVQMLRALAIRVRNETMIHDLKVNVARLQANRVTQLMIRHGMIPDDQPDEPAGEEQPEPAEPADTPDASPATDDEPTRQAA